MDNTKTSSLEGSDKKPSQSFMSASDDIALLNEVSFSRPWESRRSAAGLAWEKIAKKLTTDTSLSAFKSGPALRKRTEFLLKKHAANEHASLRKSGSTEEYDVRTQLLTDVATRIADYEQYKEVHLDLDRRKMQGLINSGEAIRQTALQSTSKEFNGVSSSSSDNNNDIPRTATNKKRKASTGKFCSKKTRTKRESLDLLLRVVSEGVSKLSKADDEMAAIQRERLEFDREQSALAREQLSFAREQAIVAEQRYAESQRVMIALLQEFVESKKQEK
ncbi:hypothetical protein DYB26_004883 [Aphanomyces astaci]|uniref:Uncharacterized protein n=2 Tax=Aphanomyces astaci TaxID=112090 RepID=A0A397EME9_APHAT|nr:hypothetical protein DYB31_007222 [Aphanomyces astaci]RHZ28579.1 hypothetical protein DYB26_004883 [Aphanomyces astaci]